MSQTLPITLSPGHFLDLLLMGNEGSLTEVLLDAVEDVHAKPAVHHVDRQPPLAESPSTPDSVQICFIVRVAILVHWQIEVDDN